jgi:superfamily II DNA or RNA helicase
LQEFLESHGWKVQVTYPKDYAEKLDLSRITKNYVTGMTLFDHQHGALHALLACVNGCVRLPTGSGKTLVIAVGARFLWEECKMRSLVITSRRDLIGQTIRAFNKVYGGDLRVGQAGDGIKDFEGAHVVVGSAQTMIGYAPRVKKTKKGMRAIPADEGLATILRTFQVLWMDECHRSSSDSWTTIASASRAVRRYGLSGTPLKNNDLVDARMMGCTGPLRFSVQSDELVGIGLCAKPRIVMLMSENISGPDLPSQIRVFTNSKTGKSIRVTVPMPYKEAYVKGYVENVHHNTAVIRATAWLADNGRKVLLIARRKEHFLTLKKMLEDQGIEFTAAWGETATSDRERAKNDFIKSNGSVLLATTIFDEGTDIPGIDAIVLAEGVKVNTNSLQRLGRGMRKKDGWNEVWVIDIVPTCHKTLMEHSLARCETYEDEGHEVTILTDWPPMDAEYDSSLLPFADLTR